MGLLAKAEAILELERQNAFLEKREPSPVVQVVDTVKKSKPLFTKLRKLAIASMVGLALPLTPVANNNLGSSTHLSINKNTFDLEHGVISRATPNAAINIDTARQKEIEDGIKQFQRHLAAQQKSQERDMLARLIYGEAGLGVDPFEVLHTVLNRVASPTFSNDIATIITQKNQFIGYNPEHPVVPKFRRMVDLVMDEWEDNNCQLIDGCDRFYFVTGIQGNCNKFEVDHTHTGKWVPRGQKQYAKLHHYCDTAHAQAERFQAQEAARGFDYDI